MGEEELMVSLYVIVKNAAAHNDVLFSLVVLLLYLSHLLHMHYVPPSQLFNFSTPLCDMIYLRLCFYVLLHSMPPAPLSWPRCVRWQTSSPALC